MTTTIPAPEPRVESVEVDGTTAIVNLSTVTTAIPMATLERIAREGARKAGHTDDQAARCRWSGMPGGRIALHVPLVPFTVPTVEQTPQVTITLQFGLDRALTADMIEALTNLAEVMLVQAEDGLWTAGYADGDDSEFLAHMTPATATPQITLH